MTDGRQNEWMPRKESVFDRLWTRLKDRYETENAVCGCASASRGQALLDETELTMADLRAYQRGDRSMAALVSQVDADLEADRIDDLGALVDELSRELDAGQPAPDPSTGRR